MGMDKLRWKEMGDLARGEFIRTHARGNKPMAPEDIKKVFGLSDPGLVLILQGEPWRPEYQAASPDKTAGALMAARRYVCAYVDDENNHPQARDIARDLVGQIDALL
jgi:hypothetical protein